MPCHLLVYLALSGGYRRMPNIAHELYAINCAYYAIIMLNFTTCILMRPSKKYHALRCTLFYNIYAVNARIGSERTDYTSLQVKQYAVNHTVRT